jgi:hypothetical protein
MSKKKKIRGQRSEVRCQMSDVRCRRSEVGGRRSEGRRRGKLPANPPKSSLLGLRDEAIQLLPSPASGRGAGGEGIQQSQNGLLRFARNDGRGCIGAHNSPPVEGWTPKADGVVDEKYETPALRAKTPNHPALRAPHQGRGIRNPTHRRPANPPEPSLLGLRDVAIHTGVRVASVL